jgi:hypothetical protein
MNHSILGVNAGYITRNKVAEQSPAPAAGSYLTSDARSRALATERTEAPHICVERTSK